MKQKCVWFEEFEKFFTARAKYLSVVLDALGCREGWVHGEMFRHFRSTNPGFVLNADVGNGLRHDFAERTGSSGAWSLIGEVKLLGAEYQPKVISGGSLRAIEQYLVPGKPISLADQSDTCLGNWGLIPDYFRLKNSPLGCEKILVLVADVSDSQNGDLANALRNVDFEADRRHEIELLRGMVRLWSFR